jgi:PAS domain S-box-containing protein
VTPLRSKTFQPRRLRLGAVSGAAVLAGAAVCALYGGLLVPSAHFNAVLATLSVLIVGATALLLLGCQAQRMGRTRLALQRARLERVLESADLGSWELDLHSGQVSLSARAQEILGVQNADGSITQSQWLSLIHPQDIRRVREAFAKLGGDPHQLLDIEYRIRHDSGEWVWVSSRGRAV